MPEARSESNKKILIRILVHFLRRKKLPPYSNCSNHIYVEFYRASNYKTNIYYFYKSIELHLIKG
jgi:hypothetical protein